jgi:hypothetical protein
MSKSIKYMGLGGYLLDKNVLEPQRQALNETRDAAAAAEQQNAKAMQDVRDEQVNASNKASVSIQARKRARSGSQSIFTNPLGVSATDTASTARKTLLGQ